MSGVEAPKRLLVTGVSTGLGRALAAAAIAAGHVVVGTVRRPEDAQAFAALDPERALPRLLDVTDDAAVVATVDAVEADIGPLDVVVANAGYGHEGTVEESSMAELRRQFDVNVFGAIATIKAALPHLRARRAGNIIVITSMGGLMTAPGLAFYHASKFAMEGFAASLGQELRPLGIHVTAVAPGAFRTDWAGRSMSRTTLQIADYQEVLGPLLEARRRTADHQPGDPAAAAAALLQILAESDPPSHLILGSDALRHITAHRRAVDAELATWAPLSRSTDFADVS